MSYVANLRMFVRVFELGNMSAAARDQRTSAALTGQGIILKPVFEVAGHLRDGSLIPVATATPPLPTQLSCLSQHRRLRDPKIGLFVDFIIARMRADLATEVAGLAYP